MPQVHSLRRNENVDHTSPRSKWLIQAAGTLATLVSCLTASAHDDSLQAVLRTRAVAQAQADALAETVNQTRGADDTCQLTIDLQGDFSRESVPGVVHVTNLDSGRAVKLAGPFHRAMNWFSLAEKTTVRVPQSRLRVEAFHGLGTERAAQVLDLRGVKTHTVELTLPEFYDARQRGWYAGNTHLHLMKLSRSEAERYLREVPRSDNLDLVFLSHLRRVEAEESYVSNQIVEDSFREGGFQTAQPPGLLLSNGEEHRHNFGPGGEGYGHVMMLNLKQLVRPISIGPGIMGSGTDGIPLQQGIREAQRQKATLIWCHNSFGFEDIPNWVGGLIHAQNIFDGGTRGSYEETFYRYLNLGLRVPFSAGTDWFMYDLARVHVLVDGDLTVESWLDNLRKGKTTITNGPFLELETERAQIGDTLELEGGPTQITVVGRGMGRHDFGGLELVYNGRVVKRTKSAPEGRTYYADLRHVLDVDEPGWFALRIPKESGRNEFGQPLFAHTSPVYIQLDGRRLFRTDTARQLIDEMKNSIASIGRQGRFASDTERQQVLEVYLTATKQLEAAIGKSAANR